MTVQRAGSGHREIDHTADLGFEVWAASREGLYAEAVRALAELCYERQAVEPRERRAVEVEGASPEELLVAWLQRIYLLVEMDGWLTAEAADVVCEEETVRGNVLGEPYDPQRHTLHTEIKAITYHDLAVRQEDGEWRATVIVDV